MQQLFQSAFLQALGYAIANSFWQMALVWLIYISLTGLLAMNAAAKYRLAIVGQVTGFIWFLVTFQFYYGRYSNASQYPGTLLVAKDIQHITSTGIGLLQRVVAWIMKSQEILPYISMAYLLLIVILCIRWLIGYRQTQMIRNSGLQKMPAEWRWFVNKIASQLAIKNKIQVFLSNAVTSPLTIGFLKPVILVPVASINQLTTDQLEAVLLHELAHIKRYDYLVNIIVSVVELSLFFNPFTQLLRKSIHKERENSCDDWVLQFQYNASVYAEALLRIAYLQSAPSFAMAVAGKKNDLLLRVKRMMGEKESRFSYHRQLLAFVLVTSIVISIAWLNSMNAGTQQQAAARLQNKMPAKKIQHNTVELLAVKTDSPLFNPVLFLPKPLQVEMKKNIAVAKVPASGSTLLPPKMKKGFHNDSSNSLQKIEIDFKQTKKEMQHGFAMNTALVFNDDEMHRNIREAMDAMNELKKAGLDKWVLDILKMRVMMLNENRPPEKREMRIAFLSQPAPPQDMDDNNTINEKISVDEMSEIHANILPALNRLPEMEKLKLTLAAITRIKNILLSEQGNTKEKTVKVVLYEPDPNTSARKITIRL